MRDAIGFAPSIFCVNEGHNEVICLRLSLSMRHFVLHYRFAWPIITEKLSLSHRLSELKITSFLLSGRHRSRTAAFFSRLLIQISPFHILKVSILSSRSATAGSCTGVSISPSNAFQVDSQSRTRESGRDRKDQFECGHCLL